MIAPISLSGSIILDIGRFESDSSPQRIESKLCALKSPVINRIEVPELPKSRGFKEGLKPFIPTPLITTLEPSLSILTPISLNAFNVARVSSPSKKPDTFVTPFAIEPSIIERCEIDLSPGTLIEPFKNSLGEAIKLGI
jgi:hypothetical protein